jgi:hypothetical protein
MREREHVPELWTPLADPWADPVSPHADLWRVMGNSAAMRPSLRLYRYGVWVCSLLTPVTSREIDVITRQPHW